MYLPFVESCTVLIKLTHNGSSLVTLGMSELANTFIFIWVQSCFLSVSLSVVLSMIMNFQLQLQCWYVISSISPIPGCWRTVEMLSASSPVESQPGPGPGQEDSLHSPVLHLHFPESIFHSHERLSVKVLVFNLLQQY